MRVFRSRAAPLLASSAAVAVVRAGVVPVNITLWSDYPGEVAVVTSGNTCVDLRDELRGTLTSFSYRSGYQVRLWRGAGCAGESAAWRNDGFDSTFVPYVAESPVSPVASLSTCSGPLDSFCRWTDNLMNLGVLAHLASVVSDDLRKMLKNAPALLASVALRAAVLIRFEFNSCRFCFGQHRSIRTLGRRSFERPELSAGCNPAVDLLLSNLSDAADKRPLDEADLDTVLAVLLGNGADTPKGRQLRESWKAMLPLLDEDKSGLAETAEVGTLVRELHCQHN